MNVQKVEHERLWSAVVALAIDDACAKPARSAKPVPQAHAIEAVRFLFAKSASILGVLDIDPKEFRRRLKRCMYSDKEWVKNGKNEGIGYFDRTIPSSARRAFRFNLAWF